MAWIESHQTVARHPKTKRLCRKLNISLPAAIGHLHLLWWWAMEFAEDGDLTRFTSDDIADAAQWSGDSETFVGAMFESGYIDHGMKLHDWYDYAGKLIERRKADADRKRKVKASPAEFQRSSSGSASESKCNPIPLPSNKEKELKELTPSSDEGHSRDSPAIEMEYLVQTSLSDGAQIGESGNGINASAENSDEYPKDFETFWSFYPRKVDKKAALAKWKARRRKVSPDDLITASKNYAIYCDQNAVDAQYRMHAATFLGPQDRYLRYVDDVPVEAKKQVQQPNGIDAIESYRRRMNGGLQIDSGGNG